MHFLNLTLSTIGRTETNFKMQIILFLVKSNNIKQKTIKALGVQYIKP